MNEHELLDELAAKAAGYNWERRGSDGIAHERDGRWFPFRPRLDDGDALRLAVKLEMALKSTDGRSTVIVASHQVLCTEAHNGDAGAATRLAIVRAAAEMAPKETP